MATSGVGAIAGTGSTGVGRIDTLDLAWLVGSVFLASAFFTLLSAPHPAWVWVTGLLTFPAGAYLGGTLGRTGGTPGRAGHAPESGAAP